MKLKKYSKYKNSWIDWIWYIPEGWEVRRLKFLINEFIWWWTPKTDDDRFWTDNENGINWIAISDMTNNDKIYKTKKKISIKWLVDKKLKILKKWTLIYSIFASLWKVSILEIDATTNQAILWFILSNYVDNIFLKYYLNKLEATIIALSNANTQNNINLWIVKNISIWLPPLSTQQKISKFLDSKTQQIEKLIEKDKKLIELLKEKRVSLINKAVTKGIDDNVKMKDSGIDWIGEIPERWEVKRLFGICKVIRWNSSFKRDELLNEGKYVALQYWKTYNVDEVNEQFRFFVNNEFYKSSQIVNYWDTILISTSETIEDLWHTVFYNRKNIGLIGGEQILLKPYNSILYNKYLFYFSRVFTKKLVQFATWVKVFRFNIDDLKIIYLWIPPLSTQQKIVDFLDKETAKIDEHIKKIEKRIELYEEYKKSLIYHVVTGKVEV